MGCGVEAGGDDRELGSDDLVVWMVGEPRVHRTVFRMPKHERRRANVEKKTKEKTKERTG